MNKTPIAAGAAAAALLALGAYGVTKFTTDQANVVAAPVAVNMTGVTAAQGTSRSFATADHVHSTSGTLPEARGGTNQSTYAQGDLLYASAANTLAKLAKGTGGQLLQISSTVPIWVGDTAWTNVSCAPCSNSWTNTGGVYQVAGYLKDGAAQVHLRGAIKSGTLGLAAFTLPTGYRPTNRMIFASDSNGAYGQLLVNADGTVVPNAGSNVQFNLDNVSFDVR